METRKDRRYALTLLTACGVAAVVNATTLQDPELWGSIIFACLAGGARLATTIKGSNE